MTVAPGETGGDCRRCGSPTTMFGYDGGVLGVECDECGLLHLLANPDVYGGSMYDPEDDDE